MILRRNIHIILFFTCSFFNVMAQETMYSESIEQKSYQLYLDKKWDELICVGNNAIKNDMDYFYLRMRIGIAYYEKKDYALAESHFRKAITFNSSDDLALEYLYYSLLLNGRQEEARLLSKEFSAELAEKTGTNKSSSIQFIIIEGGTKKTDSSDYYNAFTKTKSNYFKPPVYFQIGINHSLKNCFSLFHAFSYYKQKNYIGNVSQLQYYLKATVPLKKNWMLIPALHIIQSNFSSETITSITDTLWPPGFPAHSLPPPGAPPLKTITHTVSTTTDSKSNYQVGSLSFQKNYRSYVFSLGTSLYNMGGVMQYIHSGFVSYSVFGNSKLIVGATGYLHQLQHESSMHTAMAPFVYLQPYNQLSLKLSYFHNSTYNLVEDNGYLVNNSIDLTTSRYSALVNFTLNKHISLYGLYQLEHKTESYQSFHYKYHMILGGLKITP